MPFAVPSDVSCRHHLQPWQKPPAFFEDKAAVSPNRCCNSSSRRDVDSQCRFRGAGCSFISRRGGGLAFRLDVARERRTKLIRIIQRPAFGGQPSPFTSVVPALRIESARITKHQPLQPDPPEVEKGLFSADVESAINQLSALAPRASIARCMDSFKNQLNAQDFSLIFREFAQRGDWQRALRLFKYMQRQTWCKPSEHVYTIMIGIMGREGMLDKASEIFEDMAQYGVDWNVYSFTALINAYGRNGLYDASLELLARMQREGVMPNVITYNTVINACAKGGLEWAGLMELFEEMQADDVTPDIITYNTLLGTCNTRGLVDEAGFVFRTMASSGIAPDEVTYTALVETYGRAGQYDAAMELLREMEAAGKTPDVVAYNVLIDAYGKAGLYKQASEVFKQMQKAGRTPNVVTYSALLDAYGKHGVFDEVRALFEDMKEKGTEPNVITYNTLIEIFGKGGYFKEAVALFEDMLKGGVQPNHSTYGSLLFACGHGGLHKEAASIYRHLRQSSLAPTPEMFAGLVEAYGAAAMYDDALSAFNSMEEAGCPPDSKVYNALLGVYARGGMHVEAGRIICTMYESGQMATVGAYSLIAEAFARGGLFDDAAEVFQDMQDARRTPNQETYETLLWVYCTAGLFDEAKAQFLEMRESAYEPHASSYSMMLALCARRSRWDDARRLLLDMKGHRMTEAHQVVRALILGEGDEDNLWTRTEYLLDSIRGRGMGNNMGFYNALLEALWCCGQRARAARLLQSARKRGLFPEAIRRTPTMWSIDVHRMLPGGALTMLLMWLDDMRVTVELEEPLPQFVTIVVKWGMEGSDDAEEDEINNIPVRKAVLSALSGLGSPFKAAPWNKGRIICQGPALREWVQQPELAIKLALADTPLQRPSGNRPSLMSPFRDSAFLPGLREEDKGLEPSKGKQKFDATRAVVEM